MRPSLDTLLAPRSVAVFGASPRRRMALGVVTNLRRFGFSGAIYPIHPTETSVAGLACARSLADLPQIPDCAVIALSPANTLTVFRDAVERGVRAAVILGSGFAEADEIGRRIQAEIADLARSAGVAVCGPNCIGLLAPGAGVTLSGYQLPDGLATGPVAAVAQSGSVFWSLAHNRRGLRFNLLVSSGNEAVVPATDYLDRALDDPTTRVLVAFLESIRDGGRFLDLAARARSMAVPLVVLKVGRSAAGQASVVAHTGALAGSDAIFDAVCHDAGIIRVDTLDELYDQVEFLLAGRLPRSERIAALTDSGGEKTLILDWGERVGLRFPELSARTGEALRGLLAPYVPIANPLDAWGSGDYTEIYPAALHALAADEAVDVVVLGTDLVQGSEEAALYGRALLDLHVATDKPIALVTNQTTAVDASIAAELRDAGIPVLHGTEYGYRAIRRAVDYARLLTREPARPLVPSPEERLWLQDALARSTPTIAGFEATRLLARFGLPVAREEYVVDLGEALLAAERIGYPVALKAEGRGLEHKSDLGALELHIQSQGELAAAWQRIADRLKTQGDAVAVSGMLVQEMVPAGLELLVGMTNDSTFGPMIAVGLGGVLVELLDDVVYGRPPLAIEEAEAMLRRLRSARLFDGYRGMLPRDLSAAARAIVDVGRFVVAAGAHLAELDINPLIVLAKGDGVRAVDALVVTTCPHLGPQLGP